MYILYPYPTAQIQWHSLIIAAALFDPMPTTRSAAATEQLDDALTEQGVADAVEQEVDSVIEQW